MLGIAMDALLIPPPYTLYTVYLDMVYLRGTGRMAVPK